MADQQVLRIPVDTEEWDRFVDSFMKYQGELETQGDKWSTTTSGIKKTGQAFGQVESSFDKLVKAAINPAFSDKSSGVFARFEKSSKIVRDYWGDTARSLEKGSKFFERMDRTALSWGSMMKIGGVIGAGVGAITGAAVAVNGAAGGIAAQGATGRGLDLPSGAAEDFTAVYATKYHLDASDLAKLNAAKWDQNNTKAFGALGWNINAARNTPNDVLEANLQLKIGQLVRSWKAQGKPWETMMQQQGLSALFTDDQAQQAANTTDEEKRKSWGMYQDKLPGYATSAADTKKATDAWTDVTTAFDTSVHAIELDLVDLAPTVVALEKKFFGAVEAFARSDEIKTDLDKLSDGLTEFGKDLKWVIDTNNETTGKAATFATALNDAADEVNIFGLKIHDFFTGGHAAADAQAALDAAHAQKYDDAGSNTGSSDNNIGNLKNANGVGFQKFDSPQAGAIAQRDQLLRYQDRDKLTTLAQIISKYAPSSENDTAGYIDFVSKRTGIGPNDKVDLHNRQTMDAIQAAMDTVEKGHKYDAKQIDDLVYGKQTGGGDASKWDGVMPNQIDGFDVSPYTSDEANAKAQSDASDAAAPVEKQLKQYWEDFEGLFKTRRGEPEYQFQQPAPAKAPMQTSMLSIPSQVKIVVPPGYSTSVTAGSLV